ncbi:MAG: hypothetical protein KDA88_18655 [Planctomycetaceae bacterium]|nr:hypothetical protein [Planctomycetaceae bacterium]
MAILRVRAKGNGRKVLWSQLKQGKLVDAFGFGLLLTTVLTDVVTDMIEMCRTFDDGCRVVVVVPNGFTRVGFNLAILGRSFEVTCARRLVRGCFPFNPLAAEFGSNYDVVVSVAASSPEITSQIVDMLSSKYECLVIAP